MMYNYTLMNGAFGSLLWLVVFFDLVLFGVLLWKRIKKLDTPQS